MSFIAATMASVEIPAKNPAVTGASPRKRPHTIPRITATPTLVTKRTPPFLTM